MTQRQDLAVFGKRPYCTAEGMAWEESWCWAFSRDPICVIHSYFFVVPKKLCEGDKKHEEGKDGQNLVNATDLTISLYSLCHECGEVGKNF